MNKQTLASVGLSVLVSLTSGCSPADSGEPDAQSTGASGGSAGVATPADVSVVDGPHPAGPGLDATAADQCQTLACDGSRMGDWVLQQRCDQSGTYVDESCSTAVYEWSLKQATGELSFEEGLASTWVLDASYDWIIQIPSSCGGCDSESDLRGSFDSLDCVPDAEGACDCTGTSSTSKDLFGTVFAAEGNGHWNFEEGPTPERPKGGVQHEFWTCAGESEMTLYDSVGARFRFTRAQP